jgi:chromosome segregation ATPase
LGIPSDFTDSPNIVTHHVSAEKQLMMPPQKRSKKNAPTEIDREEHRHDEDNEISHALEPSQITDQERREKLEALQKAWAEKTTHILEQYTQQDAHENEDDDNEAVDKELEEVQQKIQELQKEKERFANQLQVKRKASEKLEKLNQAKEEIERIQREINEMKEQENNSLWQDSPLQNSGPNRRTPKENFFAGNGISQFVDPESALSIGLQTAPWP